MDGLKKLALAAMAVLAVPQLFSQASVVGTEAGKLQGVTQGPVESFKGVPFAAPPVGDLRWRAPQPVQPWFDVRQANDYSADCMQVPFPSDAAPLGTKPAEDCLYLNVWRPASTKADAKLPVMFWIYGGGFVNGGSSPTVYDGSKFAEKGVVFVSANYRLVLQLQIEDWEWRSALSVVASQSMELMFSSPSGPVEKMLNAVPSSP
ncbi:MAG: carboxylesterase family protein [Terracidiphilus sp.]